MTPSEILDEIAKLNAEEQRSVTLSLTKPYEETDILHGSNEFEHLSKREAFALLLQEVKELKSSMADADWEEMLHMMNEQGNFVIYA